MRSTKGETWRTKKELIKGSDQTGIKPGILLIILIVRVDFIDELEVGMLPGANSLRKPCRAVVIGGESVLHIPVKAFQDGAKIMYADANVYERVVERLFRTLPLNTEFFGYRSSGNWGLSA